MTSPYTEPSDLALERLAAAGDRDAFGALYERHCDRVYDLLLRVTRNPEDAAELMQETFISALRSLSLDAAGAASFSTWLYRIARNLALNHLQRRRTALSLDEDEEHSSRRITSSLADRDPEVNPEPSAEAHEAAAMIALATATLEPRQRLLFEMHLRHGLSSSEIAGILGVSPGSAYTMVSRMRDAVGSTMASVALYQRGREVCEDLARLLEAQQVRAFSRRVDRDIRRHVRNCETCGTERKQLVSASAVLKVLPLLIVPLALRRRGAEASWQAYSAGGGGAGGGAGGSGGQGGHEGADGKSWRSRSLRLGALAAALAAGVIGVSVAAFCGTDSRTEAVLGATAVPATAHAATATATATVTALPSPTNVSVQPTHAQEASITPSPEPTSIPTPSVTAVANETAAALTTCAIVPPALLGPSAPDAGYASALLALINAYRGDRGLPALTPDARLQQAAAGYAKTVVEVRWWDINKGDNIHDGPDCSTIGSRADAAGYPPNSWLGELVMSGSGGWSPDQMFERAIAYSAGLAENPANAEMNWIDIGLACARRPSPGPSEVACVMVLGRIEP